MSCFIPPSAFINNLVKTESLYGILTSFPFADSANFSMQLPNADRDLFIAIPSFKRSPEVPDLSVRSLEFRYKF